MTIRNNGMTVVCLLIILFLNLTILQFNTKQTEGADSQERHALIDILTLKFDFPAPTVTKGNLYDSVAMSELPSHGDPGQPVLPFKSSRVLIPQFKEIQDINVIPGTSIELEGTFKVEFGKTPLPISSNTTIEDQPDLEIYTSTDPFPGIAFQSLSEQYLRGYRILLLKLYPVQYFPKTGKLSYFDTMTLNIELAEKRTTHSFLRDLPQDTTLVQGKVDNRSIDQLMPDVFVIFRNAFHKNSGKIWCSITKRRLRETEERSRLCRNGSCILFSNL